MTDTEHIFQLIVVQIRLNRQRLPHVVEISKSRYLATSSLNTIVQREERRIHGHGLNEGFIFVPLFWILSFILMKV